MDPAGNLLSNPKAQVVTGRLNRSLIAGYALGSFGTGIYTTVPTVLLLYICTEILKIPSLWASVAVFLQKIWRLLRLT